MALDEKQIFTQLLTDLRPLLQNNESTVVPVGIAVAEGVAMSAAACARTPACANAVINLFGAVIGGAILSSGEEKKDTNPKPLPSTFGDSTNMSPNNGDHNNEDEKNKIEKTSHVKLRAEEGRPVGQAINDIQRARNSDIMIQSKDGSFVIRGINSREHIVSQEGKLVTSIANRSNQANINLLLNRSRTWNTIMKNIFLL